MKIRKVTPESYDKVSAMLRQAFPNGTYEQKLVESFHKNESIVHEWVCVHVNAVIAYVAFIRGRSCNIAIFVLRFSFGT